MKTISSATTLVAALTLVSAAQAEPTPGAPQPEGGLEGAPIGSPRPCPSEPTSTTTLTGAADATVAPSSPPRPRESLTIEHRLRPNRPLLLAGGGLLVGAYVATAAVAYSRDLRDGGGGSSLYLPVAGPWMHLAQTTEGSRDALLIAGSGVIQGAGVALAALALVLPERVPAATLQAGGVHVVLTAASYGRGSAGLGAVGHF